MKRLPHLLPAIVLTAVVSGALLLAPAEATAGPDCNAPMRAKFSQKLTIDGILRYGKGHHEAQGPFDYIYLALDKPLCVDPSDGPADDFEPEGGTQAPVTQIQVAGEVTMSGDIPIGKPVTLTGTLFAAHTMWHVEEVLIEADTAELR